MASEDPLSDTSHLYYQHRQNDIQVFHQGLGNREI